MKIEHLESLQGALGYQFKDLSILEKALVHASTGGDDNEQLEFLGDAALGYAVTAALYQGREQLPVGELAELKANLISNLRLAPIALELGIDRRLVLGPSIIESPTLSSKVCADALEAVIGAICIDGGVAAVQTFVNEHIYDGQIVGCGSRKHPKTQLQEWAVARRYDTPRYEVVGFVVNRTVETWSVRCGIEGIAQIGSGTANSKRGAERKAAESMLQTVTDA